MRNGFAFQKLSRMMRGYPALKQSLALPLGKEIEVIKRLRKFSRTLAVSFVYPRCRGNHDHRN